MAVTSAKTKYYKGENNKSGCIHSCSYMKGEQISYASELINGTDYMVSGFYLY